MNLIGNKDKDMKCITSIVLLLVASISMAQSVPNTFTAGDPALAAEVNENFADLDARTNTNAAETAALSTTVGGAFVEITVESSLIVQANGLAISYCPPDTIPVSASCACEGDGVIANFGMLALCAAGDDGIGLGAAAFCDIDFTYDPNLPDPLAAVYAICMGATKADGTKAQAGALSPKEGYQKSMGIPSNLQLQIEGAKARQSARKARAN